MTENGISGDGSDFQLSPKRAEPDAHGQAALLLAESILHALVEANSLTIDEAISIVRTATEVKIDVAAETGESLDTMERSIGLLSAIERTLAAGRMDGARD